MNQPAVQPDDLQDEQLDEDVVTHTLNELINIVMDIKLKESALNDQINDLKKARETWEKDIIQLMRDQGIDRTGTDRANVLVQLKRFPQVKDWDAFYEFIHENNAMHLLQRRVSTTAIAEYEASDETVPGIEFYEEDQLTVRKR